MIEAMILCGGMGTRLREETEFKPKPMVSIGGFPMLWHIMKVYEHYGVKDFVLCLGYRGDVIREYFLNYRNHSHDVKVDLATGKIDTIDTNEGFVDWRVTLAETGPKTLTGLRIAQALRHIRNDTFLVTYGDGVADVDIGAVIAHHRRMGKLATVTAVHPSSRFGELTLDTDTVRNFAEKPQTSDGWINGGFFVFEKRAFDIVGPGEDVSLEQGVLERLAEMGELAVYRHGGFWQCMDTYREQQLLEEMWTTGRAPWRKW